MVTPVTEPRQIAVVFETEDDTFRLATWNSRESPKRLGSEFEQRF